MTLFEVIVQVHEFLKCQEHVKIAPHSFSHGLKMSPKCTAEIFAHALCSILKQGIRLSCHTSGLHCLKLTKLICHEVMVLTISYKWVIATFIPLTQSTLKSHPVNAKN